jgi:multidrug efflux pump subunit AcrA (membrane-fusion protein)
MKPGMYADVEILDVGSQSQLLVPLDAVIYTGKQKKADRLTRRVGFAYVEIEAGKFETRVVTLGEDGQGEQVRVVDGLKENELVVVSGRRVWTISTRQRTTREGSQFEDADTGVQRIQTNVRAYSSLIASKPQP